MITCESLQSVVKCVQIAGAQADPCILLRYFLKPIKLCGKDKFTETRANECKKALLLAFICYNRDDASAWVSLKLSGLIKGLIQLVQLSGHSCGSTLSQQKN